jgi:sulfur-oxidizing protein SoxX
MSRRGIILVVFAAFPCAATEPGAYIVQGDAIVTPLAAGIPDAAEGRRLFVDRDAGHCVLCHRVATLEAPFQGDLGPALDDVGARLDAGQIRLRIVDASRLNPATVMPPYYRLASLEQVASEYRGQPVLSPQAIEHLVAWLVTLQGDTVDERP